MNIGDKAPEILGKDKRSKIDCISEIKEKCFFSLYFARFALSLQAK